jgi:hypothetical protein
VLVDFREIRGTHCSVACVQNVRSEELSEAKEGVRIVAALLPRSEVVRVLGLEKEDTAWW